MTRMLGDGIVVNQPRNYADIAVYHRHDRGLDIGRAFEWGSPAERDDDPMTIGRSSAVPRSPRVASTNADSTPSLHTVSSTTSLTAHTPLCHPSIQSIASHALPYQSLSLSLPGTEALPYSRIGI